MVVAVVAEQQVGLVAIDSASFSFSLSHCIHFHFPLCLSQDEANTRCCAGYLPVSWLSSLQLFVLALGLGLESSKQRHD